MTEDNAAERIVEPQKETMPVRYVHIRDVKRLPWGAFEVVYTSHNTERRITVPIDTPPVIEARVRLDAAMIFDTPPEEIGVRWADTHIEVNAYRVNANNNIEYGFRSVSSDSDVSSPMRWASTGVRWDNPQSCQHFIEYMTSFMGGAEPRIFWDTVGRMSSSEQRSENVRYIEAARVNEMGTIDLLEAVGSDPLMWHRTGCRDLSSAIDSIKITVPILETIVLPSTYPAPEALRYHITMETDQGVFSPTGIRTSELLNTYADGMEALLRAMELWKNKPAGARLRGVAVIDCGSGQSFGVRIVSINEHGVVLNPARNQHITVTD